MAVRIDKPMIAVLTGDGIAGAGRFKDGLGRHGDFDRIR
jgi:hypothetical protein